LLDELGRVEPLVVTRTKSGEEYCDTLNRIRFFVSADVGMGEFMIKNFEAMACGCVLLAYDQGEAESRALGLQDMHNIVFYQTIAQLQEKLAQLRADPELARRIASNGRELVVAQLSFARIGERIVEALKPALRARAPLSLLEKVRLKLGV
jgi:glycosyltransferase involved in cell wall biosynthesis